MKYLIAALGNIGDKYKLTRHNIGFTIADAFVNNASVFLSASVSPFTEGRYAFTTTAKYKGRTLIFIKPSTYMNLSGKAVRYWMIKEKISLENVLVLTDDLALPFGRIRIRAKGSDGGHNGLANIQELLGTKEYPRLRFGVGNSFYTGHQVNYVLGNWTEEEYRQLPDRLNVAIESILCFTTQGIAKTMSIYNSK